MKNATTFDKTPVLNSPYEVPARHWVLDSDRQPTQEIDDSRRQVSFITPIPKPRKVGRRKQREMSFDERSEALGDERQQYELGALIDSLRQEIAAWRALPEQRWRVTPETARLLKHWRHHQFSDMRPFFCQVEAVETAIWLTEVAPSSARGRHFLDRIEASSEQANPGLPRLALKLATGAGKTTVMAMLIAWQTVNAARRPKSPRFTRGFLVVAPGITVRDRLRVLQPNDPGNYYRNRELVPADMLRDLDQAAVVVTNFHAFMRRETFKVAAGNRRLLRGRRGNEIETRETEGQMLNRVCAGLMRMKGIIVFNDEAHHCYREKPGEDDEGKLTAEERTDADRDNKAARVWISGLEVAQRKLGVKRVFDLSATPFFLRGSGYAEGTLFPWTVSDFSLMDAIECGIVKLPRVPVIDELPDDMPMFRNLWEHIGRDMPKRRSDADGDPAKLPRNMRTALDALYGHYEETFDLWREANTPAPPCFIVVCNGIATSKLVYEYIAGYHRGQGDDRAFHKGRLELFRNFDASGTPLPRPPTLLIDSRELESGEEKLDAHFRRAAADEIERFRRERGKRGDDAKITDQELLREVLNTVGKPGQLGSGIRCVVSVAMLTEGWDANTVTHIFGLRAFGTQLLCEQVVGRSLRRQSYTVDEEGRFGVEYADVFGIPFDFTAKPVIAKPQPPPPTVHVRALSPERDSAEIRFPRVVGYRKVLADDRLDAEFTEESKLVLTPETVGAPRTTNQAIIGEGHDLTADHLDDIRQNAVAYELAIRLVLDPQWRDGRGKPQLHLFGQLKRIVGQWLRECFQCKGGARVGHLLFTELADEACQRIVGAITRPQLGHRQPVKALVAPYDAEGSTRHVSFTTSRTQRYATSARSHVNWAILDSTWEGEMCRVLDSHPSVRAWVKNRALGFDVPYKLEGSSHRYIPDFIAHVDDGCGADDPLQLVVEVKGYRGEDAKAKKAAMETCWVPGVNALGTYGRWDFLEMRSAEDMERCFDDYVTDRRQAATAVANTQEETGVG